MRAPNVAALACLAVIGVAGACTPARSRAPATPSTIVSTHTVMRTTTVTPPAPTYDPPAPASVAPLPPGAHRDGEQDRRCPYLRTGLDQDADSGGDTMANLEGNRIYRTTVLTGGEPVSCRFYYYAPPYQAVAAITPATFATATDAHNALVRTAQAGHNLQPLPGFAPGVDGIGYQTRFFGPDANRDWAFAFAKGRVLVVVHTQQNDSPLNAVRIGKAVAGKF